MDWRYLRRRTVNIVNLSGSVLATVFGLFWLFWIIWTTLSYGVTAIDWNLFRLDTPAPGGTGGLANAIVGSLIMVGLATAIGTPVGILAGTYLAEYGGRSFVAGTIRFLNDILLSAPSIIIGLFIYELVVIRMGHFSALAGALGLPYSRFLLGDAMGAMVSVPAWLCFGYLGASHLDRILRGVAEFEHMAGAILIVVVVAVGIAVWWRNRGNRIAK